MNPHEPPMDDPCPDCGTTLPMVDGRHTLTRTVAGVPFEQQGPAKVCPACGVAYVASDVRDSFDAFVARELWSAGVRSPDALSLYLGAFGVAPEAIGASLREVKAWRLGAPVPARVWPALEAAVHGTAPVPARAVG